MTKKKQKYLSNAFSLPLSKKILLGPSRHKNTREGSRGFKDKKMKIKTKMTSDASFVRCSQLRKEGEETKRDENTMTTTLCCGDQEDKLTKIIIHEDIVREIFLRLPMKSLHRCKSLSWIWHHEISSVRFLRNYMVYRGITTSGLLLGFFRQPKSLFPGHPNPCWFLPASTEGEKLKTEDGQKAIGVLPFDERLSFLTASTTRITTNTTSTPIHPGSVQRMVTDIGGSSNGFLLVTRYQGDDRRKVYYVCNPITKQSVILPESPLILHCVLEDFICQGSSYPFLESVSYKVVRCLRLKTYTSFLYLEIFSSLTGEWFQLPLFLTECIELSGKSAISDRGTFCMYATADFGMPLFVLIDLNLKIKEYRVLSHPGAGSPLDTCLGRSQGFIQFMRYNSLAFEIWELNEDGNVWCLKYTISMPEMFPMYADNDFGFVAFHPKDSALVLLYARKKIMLFDMKNKRVELNISSYWSLGRIRSFNFFSYQWPCWPPLIT